MTSGSDVSSNIETNPRFSSPRQPASGLDAVSFNEETVIGTTYSNNKYGKLTFFIMKVDEKTNMPKELNPEEWIE